MIGPGAFDFVLGVVFGSVMDMAFVVEVSGMDGNDRSRHPTGFRIPAYMIADLESPGHLFGPLFSKARLSVRFHHCAPRHGHCGRE
jgi:hypothetical protein